MTTMNEQIALLLLLLAGIEQTASFLLSNSPFQHLHHPIQDAVILSKNNVAVSPITTTTTMSSSRYIDDELSILSRRGIQESERDYDRADPRRLQDLEEAVERRLDNIEHIEDNLEERLDALAIARERRREAEGGKPYDLYRRGTDMGYYRRSVRDRDGSDYYRGNNNYDFRDTWSSVKQRYRNGYNVGRRNNRYDWGRTGSVREIVYDGDRYGRSRGLSRQSISGNMHGSSIRERDHRIRDRDNEYYKDNIRSGNIIGQIWEKSRPRTVQGGSLVTWSFSNPQVEWLHVLMKSEGRPVDADVQLWHGPDNIPQRVRVYVEDALEGTFSAFIATPRTPSTVAIRNTGAIEFPLDACVGPDYEASYDCADIIRSARSDRVQGGATVSYPYSPTVGSVLVFIETEGRPINARIELIQGPNHNKQVMEVYSEDGIYRPFMAVLQTPGAGTTIRIVNTSPVEFPMTAVVVPYEEAAYGSWGEDGVVLGRSGPWGRG